MKSKPEVQIYYDTNIDALEWPESNDAQITKKYLTPLIKHGTKRYIDNVDANMLALKVDDIVMPVSIANATRYANSYVCSPYSHYITYAVDEIPRLGLQNPRIERLLSKAIAAFGVHLKWLHLDKVAIINNWLFSSILYPELTKQQIGAITAFMVSRYPEHAIVFRCISDTLTSKLKTSLAQSGYQMVVSRPISVLDTRDDRYLKRKHTKSDMKLFQRSGVEVIGNRDVTPEDMGRLVGFYNALYLNKYTYNNPQYNHRFFELMDREQICTYRIIRKGGQILGFAASFSLGTITSVPFVGHDLDAPKEMGLFRILMAIVLRDAKKSGMTLHWSSGVAEFKRRRGAAPGLEYYAIYHKHLPIHRRLPWHTLAILLNRTAPRVAQES
jgi:hypothetical protein